MSWFGRERLVRQAMGYLKRGDPIPLDLVAHLNDVGVTIADLHLGGTA